ncbi:metallophosphoesterase [Ruminococcus sp. OA3]|uniref:metallophosphoesterase family protein n=1 Tax=Ruminococcus sp. OA3 TaxID=2914164 RepID=UPI001F062C6A|nr:metallophosphoesterase family protein [Ruminococcus sp. OA3]MCH1981293.1 metallophosphoesterase [Ruminococcus sp. OA3]
MIFVTGDCHGDYRRFREALFPQQSGMTKDDYVIVCGDFGFWDTSEEGQYWFLKWLEARPFTTLWLDGNHENFDLLKTYETCQWNGGMVQFINPSLIHLMRGQVYELQGKRVFTFGGARSHDISGGILERDDPQLEEKKHQLEKENKLYRVNHLTWWKEEIPTEEEMEEGLKNLKQCGWQVDVILTHCCPDSLHREIDGGWYESDPLTWYLEQIRSKCDFKRWVFGHYHRNWIADERSAGLYEEIVRMV